MKTPRFLLAGFAAVLLLVPSALNAWWDGGHKAVALIAYERLTPEERDWVMSLLDQMPTQEHFFAAQMEKELGAAPDKDARARWYFAQAAIWPDLVRDAPSDEAVSHIKQNFNRPTRHYTDLPVFASAADRAELSSKNVEPDMKWSADLLEPQDGFNSMQTLARILAQIPDRKIDAARRGVDVCWLFHLVGDTHQPCHCAQLFLPKKLPDGDRGANSIHIFGAKNLGRGLTKDALHAVWDSYLNDAHSSLASVTIRITELRTQPALWKKAEAAASVNDPVAWLREGHALAEKHVYSPLLLKYVDKADPQASTYKGRTSSYLPLVLTAEDLKTYDAESELVARQQIVTAGVRLATTLKSLAAKAK